MSTVFVKYVIFVPFFLSVTPSLVVHKFLRHAFISLNLSLSLSISLSIYVSLDSGVKTAIVRQLRLAIQTQVSLLDTQVGAIAELAARQQQENLDSAVALDSATRLAELLREHQVTKPQQQ